MGIEDGREVLTYLLVGIIEVKDLSPIYNPPSMCVHYFQED